MEVARVEAGGVRLHVEVAGPSDGVPVLFLHGVGSSARTWDWLPVDVVGAHRVVRVDQRGHGRSDHAPGTYALARYGADAVAVLRDRVTAPALLVGHSLGGVVAWWVAQHHPELVAALLLEDPPLLAGEAPKRDAGRFRDVFRPIRTTIVEHRRHALAEGDLAERIGALRWGPASPPLRDVLTSDAIAALAFGYHRLDLGVIDGAIDGSTLAATDTRTPVPCPVTIVAADDKHGAAFSSADAARLASHGQRARVIRIRESGHRIHQSQQHRAAYLGHLERFLGGGRL